MSFKAHYNSEKARRDPADFCWVLSGLGLKLRVTVRAQACSGSSMTSRAAVTIIDAGWTGAELAVVWGWMFFLLALLQCICWVGVRLWHLPRQTGEVAEAENVQPKKTREEIGVQTADASPIQRRNKIPTSLKDFPEAKKAQATLAAIVSKAQPVLSDMERWGHFETEQKRALRGSRHN